MDRQRLRTQHSALCLSRIIMIFLNFFIITSVALYVSYGKETKQAEKSRGEILAIETNSELVSSNENIKLMQAQTSHQCSRDGSVCLTCRSVGMCRNGVLTEIQCRGLYPYCDARTGSCTNERRRCKEEEKSMPCSSRGYFPDPQSCRSFHICEGEPMMSYKFACAPLQIYNHEEKKCSRPSFSNRCVSFACFGKQGRYTPYPSDRSMYTLCSDASATELFKCPDNHEFDESKQKCVPACSSEENMPDKDDETCRKYYRCVKSGRAFDAVLSTCSMQRVFDPEQLKCVPKTSNFKCNMNNPTQIGSIPSTISTLTPDEQGESIGETEETFFRQNPHQNQLITEHPDKSPSLVGSVHHKATESELIKSKQDNDDKIIQHPTTMATIEKTTLNVGPIMSMLITPTELQPSKQIVVRETQTETLNTKLSTESTKQTSPNDKQSLKESISTTSNNNNIVTTTLSNINQQTYTITTDNLLTSSDNSVMKQKNEINLPDQKFNIDHSNHQKNDKINDQTTSNLNHLMVDATTTTSNS